LLSSCYLLYLLSFSSICLFLLANMFLKVYYNLILMLKYQIYMYNSSIYQSIPLKKLTKISITKCSIVLNFYKWRDKHILMVKISQIFLIISYLEILAIFFPIIFKILVVEVINLIYPIVNRFHKDWFIIYMELILL
jgi:hypothetical protein